ncbi:hypothetical protein GU700_05930 [Methylobacterium sp. NI91]|nr:hypothetical protein CLZ_05930 [Methylobacterium sp. CLZ]QIJ79064.1 hypothetical protein GU700_05930 [Methylobacterium sp. NI91]
MLARRRFRSQAEARMACFSYILGLYNPLHRHSATARPCLRAEVCPRGVNNQPAQPSPQTVHKNGAIPIGRASSSSEWPREPSHADRTQMARPSALKHA